MILMQNFKCQWPVLQKIPKFKCSIVTVKSELEQSLPNIHENFITEFYQCHFSIQFKGHPSR